MEKTLAFAAIVAAVLIGLLVGRKFLPWCRRLDSCTASVEKTLAFAAIVAAALIGLLIV